MRYLLCPLLVALATTVLPAHADTAAKGVAASKSATPAAATARTQEQGTVVLGGRDIVTFRATVNGHRPPERADTARHRAIGAYLRNQAPRIEAGSVPEGTQVLADGVPLFIVVAGDVDTLAGETVEGTAALAVQRVQLVLEELRERRDPGALARGAGLALALTLVWILLLRGLIAFDRWAGRRFAAAVERRVQEGQALDARPLLRIARASERVLAWLLGFALTFLWLNAVLQTLPYTRPWGERITGMLLDVLDTIGTSILDSLPGLLFIVVILVLARFATRGGAAFFERVRKEDLRVGWLDRDTAAPARMIFTFLVWLFAIAMAYPYFPGSHSQAFQGLSVLVGLMISIGASGTVAQATGGLILMFTRAFRVGEFVNINGTEGTVMELGLFSTRVRTGMGVEVMLPNSVILGTDIKNYSRAVPGTGFVVDTVVTIGYDTPWRQVEAMLLEAASRVESIVKTPAPRVMQTGLSDFYVEYRLLAYSSREAPLPRAEAMSHLHAHIQDVFNEYGVQIMSPHYLGDPATAKVVPKALWFEAPARK